MMWQITLSSQQLSTRRVKKALTVEEVQGTDSAVIYDTMKAVVTFEVKRDGSAALTLQT